MIQECNGAECDRRDAGLPGEEGGSRRIWDPFGSCSYVLRSRRDLVMQKPSGFCDF